MTEEKMPLFIYKTSDGKYVLEEDYSFLDKNILGFSFEKYNGAMEFVERVKQKISSRGFKLVNQDSSEFLSVIGAGRTILPVEGELVAKILGESASVPGQVQGTRLDEEKVMS